MYQTRKEDMSVERKPTAFGDMRGWMAALKARRRDWWLSYL